METRTVLVAMSGGVDSSVAAALLVEQGHRVIGVTMKTFCYSETEGPSQTCCGLDGIMDARRVADMLRPDGVFFCSVVEYQPMPLTWKRRAAMAIRPCMAGLRRG